MGICRFHGNAFTATIITFDIRDKGKSRQQLTELYEDEEEEKDGDEKKGRKKRHPSQERDTLESNARRALKSSNLERHERRSP